jgi:hypothetical protein
MPDSEPFSGAESLRESHRVNLILRLIEIGVNRRFQFKKLSQSVIGTHNETLSVAVGIGNARFSAQTFVQTISL